MDWNDIMVRELDRAKTGAKLTKVPEGRRPSEASLLRLERDIAAQINENEAMCTRSKSYAASMAIR